jgi:hypothetical protein
MAVVARLKRRISDMKKTAVLVSALALSLPLLLADGVSANSGVNVGALSCTVSGGIGLLIGSKKSMSCTFEPTKGRATQYYKGSIGKLGIDVGITGKSYISWLVFAPGELKSGALAGNYGGVSGEATVGLGLGANVLVGGSGKSIALQPVSVQGQTGLNVAAGIASLKLRFVK